MVMMKLATAELAMWKGHARDIQVLSNALARMPRWIVRYSSVDPPTALHSTSAVFPAGSDGYNPVGCQSDPE